MHPMDGVIVYLSLPTQLHLQLHRPASLSLTFTKIQSFILVVQSTIYPKSHIKKLHNCRVLELASQLKFETNIYLLINFEITLSPIKFLTYI